MICSRRKHKCTVQVSLNHVNFWFRNFLPAAASVPPPTLDAMTGCSWSNFPKHPVPPSGSKHVSRNAALPVTGMLIQVCTYPKGPKGRAGTPAKGGWKYSLLKHAVYNLRIWQWWFQSDYQSSWTCSLKPPPGRVRITLPVLPYSQTWFIEKLKWVEAFIFGGLRDHDISKWQWSSFFSLALGIGWGEAGQHLHLARLSATPKRVVKRTQCDSSSWNVCQVYDSLKSMGWLAPNAWSVQEVKANSLGSCMDCAGRSERPCSSFAHVS